jgi:hypothetical protein
MHRRHSNRPDTRFTHSSHLSYRNVQGAPTERRAILAHDASDIHIINRELVPWLIEQVKLNGGDWPYDMVVIDEASSFKSSKSERFKALRKALPAIPRMVQLTGTPASNGLLDVWAQIYLLDQGARLGRTFGGYKAKYFDADYMGYNFSLKSGTADRIYETLDGLCLTLSAADYLELPEWIDRIHPVELPSVARTFYAELEREFIAKMATDTVEVLSAAALSNKLLQVANGAVYTGNTGEWTQVHDAKLDALELIVAESAGSSLLVAVNYKTDTIRIRNRFPQAVELGRDPAQIDAWNRGEIPMLLAHPASAGHGLNLQAGGHVLVWYGLNWSLELYQQMNARLLREGQTKPVMIHHLVATGTVDETVLAALDRKDIGQRALLSALKADILGLQAVAA